MRIPLHYKITVLTVCLIVFVSYVIFQITSSASSDVLFKHEETDLREEGLLNCRKLESHINQLRQDALALSSSQDVIGLADLVHAAKQTDGSRESRNKLNGTVEDLFIRVCVNQLVEKESRRTGPASNRQEKPGEDYTESELRPYYMVRLIDARGMEVCRLEMNREAGEDVPKPLEDYFEFHSYEDDSGPNKQGEEFFRAAKRLHESGISIDPPQAYLSQFDLDSGEDDSRTPRPTLLAWVPLLSSPLAKTGKREFLGMVIVNLDVNKIRTEMMSSPRHLVYMWNNKGQFLIHPDRTREFAWRSTNSETTQNSEVSTKSLLETSPWNDRPRIPVLRESLPSGEVEDENREKTIADTFKPDFRDSLMMDNAGKQNLRLAYLGWQVSDAKDPAKLDEGFYLAKYKIENATSESWKEFERNLISQSRDNDDFGDVLFQNLNNVRASVIFRAKAASEGEFKEAVKKAAEGIKDFNLKPNDPEYLTECHEFISHFFRIYLQPGTDSIPQPTDGTRPIVFDEHISLLFAFSKDEMDAELGVLNSEIWKKAIVMSLVLSLLATVVGFLLTRRLRNLKIVADDITLGHFDSEIPRNKGIAALVQDEVCDLVNSFRIMRNEVVEREREIRNINSNLEGKVVARTQELQLTLKELKRERDKAEHLNQAKDVFLASVSHELRNPLNQISGFCQLLELSELSDGQRDDVGKVRSASVRQLGLVNDILDYQKILMQGLSLVRTDVPVAALLQNVYHSQRFRAEELGIQLLTECEESEDQTIYGEQRRLMQVLENLVGNALKFSPGGTVILSAELQKRGKNNVWLLKVKDNGRGMHPHEIEQLFQPFKTFGAGEGNEGGTGLGLVIARGLCEAMNGDIDCQSVFGKGSSFTIRIPQTDQDKIVDTDLEISSAANTMVPPAKVDLPRTKPKQPAGFTDSHVFKILTEKAKASDVDPRQHTILVIDDEADSRELISRYLGELHFRVEVASNGVDGLNKAKSLQPSLITLDARMPDIDGWAILAALSNDPETSMIPVVMVTVSDQVRRAHVLGARAFITKPIDWEKFSEVIMNQISGGRTHEIMVIDDDAGAREILRRILERVGWKVIEAENGLKALELLEIKRPAAIVLDLLMPVMNGFEFMNKFSENPEFCSIPIIVQTAKDTTAEEQKALSGVVVQVRRKGDFSTEDLLTDLRNITG